jgi:hypothetical protein
VFSHWIWKLLGWVIALAVGAGVALWIYKKQSFKALSYQIVSISPLVPLQARGFSDLRVFKGDKPIERPILTTIRIVNTGDLPIGAADFERALTMRPLGVTQNDGFVEKSKMLAQLEHPGVTIFNVPYKGVVTSFPPVVMDARIASTTPARIPVELENSGSYLVVRPLLLNGGDEFTIELLINGDVRGIEMNGRVAGVSQITEEKPREPFVPKWVEALIDVLFSASVAVSAAIAGYLLSRRR